MVESTKRLTIEVPATLLDKIIQISKANGYGSASSFLRVSAIKSINELEANKSA